MAWELLIVLQQCDSSHMVKLYSLSADVTNDYEICEFLLLLRLRYYVHVLQIMIIWILTPYSLLFVYQRFGGLSALYHNLQGLSLIKPFHKNLKTCMFHLLCATGTCYSVCWQPRPAFLAIPMCSMCLKWVTLKLLFKKMQTSERFIQYQCP